MSRKTTQSSHRSIAVCCCTFKRAEGIALLLRKLAETLQDSILLSQVRVIVVDNDPEASAQDVVEAMQATSPYALTYVVEETPGIPSARNRSVKMALELGAEFLAFIDDDEYPESNWLEAHLDYLNQHPEVAISNGPVQPVFPDNAPQWMLRSKVFKRPFKQTGLELSTCATNNTLARSTVFQSVEPWFDDAFRFTGGSDSDFFARAQLAGHAIHRVREALVIEVVPSSRLRWRWIARRHLRLAACNSSRRIRLGQASRWYCLGAGICRFSIGLIRFALIIGWLPRFREGSLCELFRGYGKAIGCFNLNAQEYKN